MQLPVDDNTNLMQLTPASPAVARLVDATVDASTELTLNATTKLIRVYAKTQPIYLKWGTADVTASNWDEIIPANQMLDFKVPVDDSTGVLYTAVNFLEQAATATLFVNEKK